MARQVQQPSEKAPTTLAAISARAAELGEELKAALLAGGDTARIRAAIDGLQAQAAAARAELEAEARRQQAQQLVHVEAAAGGLARLSMDRLRARLARFTLPVAPAVVR